MAQKDLQDSQENGVQVSTQTGRFGNLLRLLRPYFSGKGWKIGGIVAAIVIIIIVIVGLFAYRHHRDTQKLKTQTATLKSVSNDVIQNAGVGSKSQQAQIYSKAERQLQDLIKSKPPRDLLVQAYVQLGDVYMDAKDYQKALDAYKSAANLSPSPALNIVSAMAYAAQQLGDKSEAIKYYKQAISLVSDKAPLAESTKNEFRQHIIDLGGKP